MNKSKVTKVDHAGIEFDNGMRLESYHRQDCCETHYLDFEYLSLADFEGLEFDLTSRDFFDRVEGYGIALKPLVGHPVRIPGYGYNNGFYSSQLDLILTDGKGFSVVIDISECQKLKY